MRMNQAEDDGQLAPQTITNLTRMVANLSGQARVCSSLRSSNLFAHALNRKTMRKTS
jgi:hypothetical protein